MCTGRVDLAFPLRAFLDGADGVFVGGCWPGECHYLTEGNYDALGTVLLLRRLMGRIGLDPRRLRIEWVSASQGSRFADLMDGFAREIGALGPLGTGEGIDGKVLRPRLESLIGMVPQLKLLVRERLRVPVKSEEAYAALHGKPEVDGWLDALLGDPAAGAGGLPAYHIDPGKCVGCLLCGKKCPVGAIDGASRRIHVIDQERCTRCGACLYACPPRIGAVRRVSGGSIPPPIPEEERAVARKSGRGA